MSQNSHNHELLYLAGGVALGVGIGMVLANREMRESVKTALSHNDHPKRGLGLPIGLLTLGGTLAAGAASIGPDIARYIKISSM
ncbi:MAG TPA: hypothetical protein VHX68_02455 [Planctomycetaceae bacterium]|jgi:hypothetical protein|nr:hypothetical protein [Planctomycetaceae bacterium]